MGMHCLDLHGMSMPSMGVHQCIRHDFSEVEIKFNICRPIQGKSPFFSCYMLVVVLVCLCVGVLVVVLVYCYFGVLVVVLVCWWLCKLN
jgi:hypothetical protein